MVVRAKPGIITPSHRHRTWWVHSTDTLRRLNMVVAGHRIPGPSTFLRQQRGRLRHTQQEGRGACLEQRLNCTASLPKLKLPSKHLLRSHQPALSCDRQAPLIQMKDVKNLINDKTA